MRRRWLKEQPELAKYSLPLRQGILFRVLRQLETVYSAMKLDALYALMDALELERFDAERMVMEASACGQLRVRVDKVARVVLFEENKTERDVLSDYLNALGAAWVWVRRVRRRLSVMNAEVNPANTTIEDAYGELCDAMDAAREVKTDLNEALLARSQRVLQKKLEQDRLEQDKSLSDAERAPGGCD